MERQRASLQVPVARLLVVEDDSSLSKALVDALTFKGHSAELAQTGAEALEQLNFDTFDLILLDWMLPDMEGIDILRHYRQQGGQSPVIVLTGMTDDQQYNEATAAGATLYLAKPFTLKKLSTTIDSVLASRQPAQS